MKKVLKLFAGLFLLDLIAFAVLIFYSMSDEAPSKVIKPVFYFIKYCLGFPLVLINNKSPFFLNEDNINRIALISLVVLNNFLLSFFIIYIYSIICRLIKNKKK